MDEKKFRTIKTASKYGKFSNYELSDDGTEVREIQTKKTIPMISTARTTGVKLINDAGEEKTFGIATIYRWTWYKPLNSDKPSAKKVTDAVVKEKKPRMKKGKIKSSLIAGKDELLSEYRFRQLIEGIKSRRSLGSTGASVEISEKSGNLVRVVFDNVEKNQAIVRVDSADWRNGYWFLNLDNGNALAFEDEKHRKDGKTGDENILWPDTI